MTFTELFTFKFLSDLGVLKYNKDGVPIDFLTVYNVGKDDCLKYYLSNVRPYIKILFKESKIDGTTIINGLSLKENQNQDNLFYDILESFKEYGKLRNIDPQFKSRLYEDFLKGTVGKKQLAQFFTPRNVIKAMVDLADVKSLPNGSKVLDPAGGVGGFLIETIINRVSNDKQDFFFNGDKLIANIEYKSYDYDAMTIVLAKSNLLICLTELLEENPTLTEEFSELLNTTFSLTNKSIIGSLDITEESYDLIMSNPPYVSRGLDLYKRYIKADNRLKNFYSIGSVGKEGLFVQKIIKELKPNRKAFIILPDGFFYRPADNKLKEFIIENCYIECIISLPEKTFYSTNKKTYILGLTKKTDKTKKQIFPVICGLIQTIGESLDVNRIPNDKNDLIKFVSEFKFYNADRNNFKPSLKNIKLIEFDSFQTNLNWIIEKYWSFEEKVELGLEEQKRIVSDEDIFDNIDYFQSELSSIKKEIEDRFNVMANKRMNYFKTTLMNQELFELKTSSLGYTKKEYSKLDTKNENDIPIFTATNIPVAHIKEINGLEPIRVKKGKFHISFASDGDGTAGKNIILHDRDYYLNTSRISFSIKNDDINPKYIYYFLQDIKKKYGFDFKHKANLNNVSEIEISIPQDKKGNFDKHTQIKYVEEYEKILELNKKFIDRFFSKVKEFHGDINNQIISKFKESFNVE